MKHIKTEGTSLTEFIEVWGQEYPNFKILLSGTDAEPFSISIRYPVHKFYGYYLNNFREWGDLKGTVAEMSLDTMVVVSDRELFYRGAIEIAIAFKMDEYSNDLAIKTLRHLARQLAPSPSTPASKL